MAVTVQTDAGDVAGANAYIAVADFKAYHDTRGNSYAGKTDDMIGYAIVKATDYVDARFAFRGVKVLNTQTTKWPRKAGVEIFLPWFDVTFLSPDVDINNDNSSFVALVAPDGTELAGIPDALKAATAEYALRALSANLFQDAPAAPGGRLIRSQTVKVDVIEQTIEYEPGQAGAFQMPAYPIADLMLSRAGLVEVGRIIFR